MPNSKHRKKQLTANRKQLEKIRKKIKYQNTSFEKQIRLRKHLEVNKENLQQEKTPLGSKQNSRKKVHCEVQEALDERSGWLSGLCAWCQSGLTQVVTQGVEVAATTYAHLAYHKSLKRQLDDANVKLRALEQELSSMREKYCKEGKKKINESSEVTCKEGQAFVPPPPPPPPIPPPPAPFRKVLTRNRTSKLVKLGDKKPPAITLDDIKKVKLKRINGSCSKECAQRESGNKDRVSVISMADLKAIKLHRTRGNSSSSKKKSFRCSRFDQLSPEFCRMKHLLKKVGPTTRSRLDGEFGEGPTPMLTRALRRKFLAACPVSPMKSFSPSPSTSSASTCLNLHTSQTSPVIQPSS